MANLEGQLPQDPIEELMPAYALNALEPEERERVERALAEDERYRDALQQYLEAATALSTAHVSQPVSEDLRHRVLAAIEDPPASRARLEDGRGLLWRLPRSLAAAWSAAAVFLLGLGALSGYVLVQQDRVHDLEVGFTQTQLAMEDQQQALETALSSQQALADELSEGMARTKVQFQIQQTAVYWAARPGVETIVLRSSEDPPSRAMLMLNADHTRGLLMALGLRPLHEASSYQAWLWRKDGTATSVAVFTPDETGAAQVMVLADEDMTSYEALTVSIAPVGGSEVPGSPIMRATLVDQ